VFFTVVAAVVPTKEIQIRLSVDMEELAVEVTGNRVVVHFLQPLALQIQVVVVVAPRVPTLAPAAPASSS
jgi:hypothetical protein